MLLKDMALYFRETQFCQLQADFDLPETALPTIISYYPMAVKGVKTPHWLLTDYKKVVVNQYKEKT